MVDPNKYSEFKEEPTDPLKAEEALGGILGSLMKGEPIDTEPGRRFAAHITNQQQHIQYLEDQYRGAVQDEDGKSVAYWKGQIARANIELGYLQQGFLPGEDSRPQ